MYHNAAARHDSWRPRLNIASVVNHEGKNGVLCERDIRTEKIAGLSPHFNAEKCSTHHPSICRQTLTHLHEAAWLEQANYQPTCLQSVALLAFEPDRWRPGYLVISWAQIALISLPPTHLGAY